MGRRDMGVINSEHLRIPVWMGTITYFGGSNHNIATAACVDCIPVTADVVCCVVDRKLFC